METFQGLLNGFSIALTAVNLLFAFLGALLGTAIGVMPGPCRSATRPCPVSRPSRNWE